MNIRNADVPNPDPNPISVPNLNLDPDLEEIIGDKDIEEDVNISFIFYFIFI